MLADVGDGSKANSLTGTYTESASAIFHLDGASVLQWHGIRGFDVCPMPEPTLVDSLPDGLVL